MTTKKNQKEVNKAIGHLIKYAEGEVWADRHAQCFDESLSAAAALCDIHIDELAQILDEHNYMDMTFAYLFEQFATSVWDNEEFCMLDTFIKNRGWRESPYARRYLTGLGANEVQFWEIVSVKQGSYVDVVPYGKKDKPIRVYERAGSKNINQWDCLAARVILLDGKYGFGGAMLLFSPGQAEEIPQVVDLVLQKLIKEQQQFLAESPDLNRTEDDIQAMARLEADSILPDLLFNQWIANIYLALTGPTPTLVNRDDELLLPSVVKFAIEEKNTHAIKQQLDSATNLDFDPITEQWLWFAHEVDTTSAPDTTVLGHIILDQKHLQLRVNSAERVNRGCDYLQKMLPGLVGPPLTMHENMDALMAQSSAAQSSAAESPQPLNQSEFIEEITAHLDQHYKNTLDEAIPALDNWTPRACAQQTERRDAVIQWLKNLENTTAKNPALAHYDFNWMWEELGIKRPV
ncbi:MAG: hypothetical protein KUG79_10165 [Pseudomonadales bacterium]|nr:hypothetical protein [Pseudomonadales bacterium]